ncbi:MAG: cytochrome C oxidase subunit IV family protein [Anaerolineales bacterium]
MEVTAPQRESKTSRSVYVAVFIALVVITAVEIGLSLTDIARGTLAPLYLVLSLGKATLVASFYMHLRQDAPIYTYIFVLPAALLAVFILMASLY